MFSELEIVAVAKQHNYEWLMPIILHYWNYFQWVAQCWVEAGFGLKEALESFAEASQWWEEVWK